MTADTRTLVDLSMDIRTDMPTNLPDHRPPMFAQYATLTANGWEGTTVTIDTHCGTHVDAPSHFIAGGRSVDEIPLDVLSGSATRLMLGNTGDPQDLPADIAPRVILHTGWSEKLAEDPHGYFTAYTSVPRAFAERLIAAGVRMVGIDTPSVDAPGVDDAHQALLGAGVIVVENLTNTATVPNEFHLTVLPLRLHGLDGSPARAIAAFGGTQ